MKFIFIILFITSSLWARELSDGLNFPTQLTTTSYTTENLLPGITFSKPVALRTLPGRNSLYIVEKGGMVYVIEDLDNPVKEPFLDISDRTQSSHRLESGLLSIAFHPNFEINHTFFACYNTYISGIHHQRVSKFVINQTNGEKEESVMIEVLDEEYNHNGGDLHFGPDGYLYISVGDEGGNFTNVTRHNIQKITNEIFSGILRIDVDRNPGNLEPNDHDFIVKDASGLAKYKIPTNNPWVGATSFNNSPINPTDVVTEFWAVGLRNPWRMSFDSEGNLWIGDVGSSAYEEINIIPHDYQPELGGMNFGWGYFEGDNNRPIIGDLPTGMTRDDFDFPVYSYVRGGAGSIIGGFLYEGSELSGLTNKFIYGDYNKRLVMAIGQDGEDYISEDLVNIGLLSAFGLHPDGEQILICRYQSAGNPVQIHTLKASESSTEDELPQLLSETGAFSDLSTLAPEAGVEPYEPIVTFWSDYALKTRWFSLADLTKTFGFEESGPWNYPEGSIWIKHFDLEMERGNPATKKRVETRFLVKTEDSIYGLSYQWNDEETEATLVPAEGSSINYTIEIDGVPTPKTWNIPSRTDCMQCHTPEAGFALSFNTRQLNDEKDIFGINQNMLTALYDHGYLDRDPGDVSTLEKLASADDETATIEHKARSYFDMNCAYCHMTGGTAPTNFDLRFHTLTENTGLINGIPLDNGGNTQSRLILPGEPEYSVLLSRVSESQGFTRMPPLATTELDFGGMQLIRDWIESMAPSQESSTVPLVSSAERIAWFNFDSDTSDTDQNLYLHLVNGEAGATDAKFGGGSLSLSENGESADVADHSLLNTTGGPWTARTTSTWFKLDEINGRQVVYEEGNGGKGFNIYIDNGTLYVGGWDRVVEEDDEQRWIGTWHNLGSINVGQWYHIAFVLDASTNPTAPSSDAFKAYLNGVEVASGEGMQLYRHGGGNGIGCIIRRTRFHDNAQEGYDDFMGKIDDLAIWNRALNAQEISILSGDGTPIPVPEPKKVTVNIDPHSEWYHFQTSIINESSEAYVESVEISLLEGRSYLHVFINGSQFTVSPDLGTNNNGVYANEVTLEFSGDGLAPGSSDQTAMWPSDIDQPIDETIPGFQVVVNFSDGTELSGTMENITDSDDDNTEFWTIVLE